MNSQPELSSVTVNAASNAIEAYIKLGLYVEAPDQVVNGIRFVPMAIRITEDNR